MNTGRMSGLPFLIGQITIMMNVLLMHLEDIDLLLSNKQGGTRINGFRLYGKGLSSYESTMTVEFYAADNN